MQSWQKNGAVDLTRSIVEFVHLRHEVPVATDLKRKFPKGPPRTETKLCGTIGFVPLERDADGKATRYAVALAVVDPKDNPSRLIGRKITEGRVLKTVAEYLDIIDPTSTHGHRAILTAAELEEFISRAQKNPQVARNTLAIVQWHPATEPTVNA